MRQEKFASAIRAAFVEGYVQGASHPKGKSVLLNAKQLAELFWRTVEAQIETMHSENRNV